MHSSLRYLTGPNIHAASGDIDECLVEAVTLAEALTQSQEEDAEVGFFHQEVLIFVIPGSDLDAVKAAWNELRTSMPLGVFKGVVRLHEPPVPTDA